MAARADYAVPLLMERKSAADLVASLADGRWRTQKAAMKETQLRVQADRAADDHGQCPMMYILQGKLATLRAAHRCSCGCDGLGGCSIQSCFPTLAEARGAVAALGGEGFQTLRLSESLTQLASELKQQYDKLLARLRGPASLGSLPSYDQLAKASVRPCARAAAGEPISDWFSPPRSEPARALRQSTLGFATQKRPAAAAAPQPAAVAAKRRRKQQPSGKLTIAAMKDALRSRGDKLTGDATALRTRLALPLPESVSARKRATPPQYVPDIGVCVPKHNRPVAQGPRTCINSNSGVENGGTNPPCCAMLRVAKSLCSHCHACAAGSVNFSVLVGLHVAGQTEFSQDEALAAADKLHHERLCRNSPYASYGVGYAQYDGGSCLTMMCGRKKASDVPLLMKLGGKKDRPYALTAAGKETAAGCHLIAHIAGRVSAALPGEDGQPLRPCECGNPPPAQPNAIFDVFDAAGQANAASLARAVPAVRVHRAAPMVAAAPAVAAAAAAVPVGAAVAAAPAAPSAVAVPERWSAGQQLLFEDRASSSTVEVTLVVVDQTVLPPEQEAERGYTVRLHDGRERNTLRVRLRLLPQPEKVAVAGGRSMGWTPKQREVVRLDLSSDSDSDSSQDDEGPTQAKRPKTVHPTSTPTPATSAARTRDFASVAAHAGQNRGQAAPPQASSIRPGRGWAVPLTVPASVVGAMAARRASNNGPRVGPPPTAVRTLAYPVDDGGSTTEEDAVDDPLDRDLTRWETALTSELMNACDAAKLPIGSREAMCAALAAAGVL